MKDKILAIFCLLASTSMGFANDLETGFRNPPPEARPWARWIWMNGNISKEGITADLEAFQRAGLGGVHMFHLDYGLPQGPVAFNSPQWLDMCQFAAEEATRLGLQLGTHNCGGWSTSGGPWTRPENSMQVVVTRELRVQGPAQFSAVLPRPASYLPTPDTNDYHEIAVLAYPTPDNELITMGAAAPQATVSVGKGAKQPTLVGDLLISFALPAQDGGKLRYLQIAFPKPFMARQLVLTPAKGGLGFNGLLEASDDGQTFTPVKTFQFFGQPYRQEYPYQQSIVFQPVSARIFRIRVEKEKSSTRPILIAEAGLSGRLTVDDLPGKTFCQRHFFQVKPEKIAATPGREVGALAMGTIVNLSNQMDHAGRLTWAVPTGNWTIVRIGHQSNGTRNHPAPEGGEGLECDKLSKEAVDAHWAGMVGRMLAKFGPHTAKAFTKVEVDSWEVGSQNWTPKFREEFTRRRGYDLTLFLPVFAGQTVDSIESTERFLWDFRRTIADLVADNYAGRLRELAHQNRMEVVAENYGTGPFDDLQYGGMIDIPEGVHWVHNGSPMSCTLLAASAAHTYGHKLVASEAFTAGETGGNRWDTDPYALKRLGDLIFCSGVNRFILHATTLQRWPQLAPGLTFGKVGSQFSRTVTWWDNGGKAWFLYLARCQWMLQQGLPVADVCVLASESAPPPTYGSSIFPDVPPGYDFDLCSTDALLHRMTCRDGRLELPDGMNYRVLMLPKEMTMTPQVLGKLEALANAGATIVGTKPLRSPGYSDYPHCDQEVRRIASQLWKAKLNHGRGVEDEAPEAAIAVLKLKPDFEARGNHPQIAYKHRSMPDAEIYFVSNQKYCTDEIEATFRVSGKVPELWNPETGAVEKAPLFREVEGRTVVPLRLDASGSVFVVFRAPAAGDHLVSDKVTPDQPVAKQALRILTASYGTFDRKSQPHVIDLTSTKAATVKRILTPLRFAGRDPAPDACKYMLAQYTVDGVFKSQAAPEDGALEMPQLPQTFKMIRVLYGVLSAKPTAADQTLDVTAKLNSLVTNGTLSVMVNKDLSGQMPASSKPKELRVEYLYNGRWNIAFMPEGQRLELPGAYEAEAAPATHELGVKPDGQIELRAWVAGRYEFTTAAGKTLCARVENVVAPQELIGAWAVMFPPDLGAPPCALFDRLMSWTESSDEGVKYFSGTATYSKEINIPAELVRQDGSLYLDLGKVKNIAQVYLNGQDMGVLWKPPFRVNISGAVRSGANKLEIKVTNLWPNRLIADERLKPDREWTSTRNLKAWPQWLLDGKPSPSGQITFTTAQHWQKDDALLPSGLFGPVRLFSTKNRVLTD